MTLRLPVFFCLLLMTLNAFELTAWQPTQKHFSLKEQADSLYKAQQWAEALALFHQLENLSSPDSARASLLSKIARSYFNLSRIDDAIEAYEESLHIRSQYLPATDTLLAPTYAMLGYLYRYYKYDDRKALLNYRQQAHCIEDHPESFDAQTSFYNAYNLATTYRLIEDHEMGLNYAYKALQIAHNENNDGFRSLSYSVMANLYNALNQNEKAIAAYQAKIELTPASSKTAAELVTDYNNMATAYLDLNRTTEAEHALQQAIDLQQGKPISARSWLIYGNLRVKQNRPTAANRLYNNALNNSNSNREKAVIHAQIGRAYEDHNHLHQAISHYNLAIELETKEMLGETVSLSEVSTPNPFLFRVQSHLARSKVKLFKTSSEYHWLKEALDSYDRLLDFAGRQREQFVTEQAKLAFQGYAHNHYESALEALFLSKDSLPAKEVWNKAWAYMEDSKAQDLLESIGRAKNYAFIAVSDSILQAESDLRDKLVRLTASLQACEVSACPDSLIINRRRQLLQINEDLEQIRLLVEEQYPTYHQALAGSKAISLDDYTKQMENNQTIMYFMGQHYVYYLAIAGNRGAFGRQPIDHQFTQELNNFQNLVHHRLLFANRESVDFRTFTNSAYALYTKLMPSGLKGSSQQLTIIPDGALNQLPFEALLTGLPSYKTINYKSLDYLIHQKEIAYAFSAAQLLSQIRAQTTTKPAKIIAFGEPASQEFSSLKGSTTELQYIKESVKNSRFYTGPAATKAEWLQSVKSDHNILHLALHASADTLTPLYSSIYFSQGENTNNRLQLYELYESGIRSQLVILSACETGLGKWQKGEGVLSLSKGFSYANNPNLIMSLWKVADRATAELFKQFYREIAAGQPVGNSLRQAKLQYLNRADELSAHPANWAGFIQLGNARQTFEPAPQQSRAYWLLALALTTIGMVVLKKARAKKDNILEPRL
ncbi:CHAT domain-containing protein [Roseivirga sp. UBA838]|uniref:CHAT domain-containing protein n=1 Tax=Roseivirga sp. UBA838 TaxID=1947393 RepID=UPI00257C0F41|nr:CHAT domain-containing protein [Roseivirga sp. UBA838]